MRIGEVIGRITLNLCDPKMIGGRFLIVQPNDPESSRENARQGYLNGRPKFGFDVEVIADSKRKKRNKQKSRGGV